MDSWYLPITIVPGLGLLILSTTNLMLSLSSEIAGMVDTDDDVDIVKRKLAQLKRINMAMVLFYLSVSFLLISALINGISHVESIATFASIIAIALALMGLIILINYSFRAVAIRQDQFKNKIA